MAKYKKYNEVPWYRKNSINSLLLFIGLVFPPFILLVAINLVTGHIYQNTYDEKGSLKTWSKANKVLAWIILVAQLLVIVSIIF